MKERQPTLVGRLLRLVREGRWSDAASALGRALKRRLRTESMPAMRGEPAGTARPPDIAAFAPPGDVETQAQPAPPRGGPA